MMSLAILEVVQGKMVIFGFLRARKRVVENSGGGVARFSEFHQRWSNNRRGTGAERCNG
jgi:hypothetical protein